MAPRPKPNERIAAAVHLDPAAASMVALENADYFAWRYFQQDMFSHQTRWMRNLDVIFRGGIIAPSGHGKTESIGKIFILQRIVKRRDIRILLVSKSREGVAAKSTKLIRDELRYNNDLISDYGLFYDHENEWTRNRFTVRRENKRKHKEGTIEAVGLGSAVTGGRFDLILADDPIDPINVQSSQQRDKVLNYFLDTIIPRLDPQGQFVFIGTRQHRYDVYNYFINHPLYKVFVEKALIREPKFKIVKLKEPRYETIHGHDMEIEHEVRILGKDKGRALCPQMWPVERLILQRFEIGTRNFNKVYQGEVTDESDAWIKSAWMEACKDVNRSYGEYLDEDYDLIVGGVDPALVISAKVAKERDTDWGVWFVLGHNIHTAKFDWLAIERARGLTPDKVVSHYVDIQDRFDPDAIYSEINSFGTIYQWLVKEDSRIYVPILAHKTTRWNKSDPLAGLPYIASLFESGRFTLPYKKEKDRVLTDKVISMLYDFDPEDHTPDELMALWIAICGYRRQVHRYKVLGRRGQSRTTYRSSRISKRVTVEQISAK